MQQSSSHSASTNGHGDNTSSTIKDRIRSSCSCELENSRFLLECDFALQYYHYYNHRLTRSRPLLIANARAKWGQHVPIVNLASICNPMTESRPDCPQVSSLQSGGPCIIIGTLFKIMKSQPNLIKELIHGDYNIKISKYAENYTSCDDYLMLQDEAESVNLSRAIDTKMFVTGINIAILGIALNDGAQFDVIEVCYPSADDAHPSCDSQIEKPIPAVAKYILFVSDLGFSQTMFKNDSLTCSLKLLVNFILGSNVYEHDERCDKIARIIIAGNSLDAERYQSDVWKTGGENQETSISEVLKQSKQLKPRNASLKAVEYLDEFFSQLSDSINVDVMPGESDPSVHLLPQQPFHPCMFPKSMMKQLFNCTTNPHHAHYDSVECFGTSGQNLDVVKQYSNLDNDIEIMKKHLVWGNCAPNAPDNLYSVPYVDEDPFTVDFVPHIYYAGCREKFSHSHYTGDISQRRTTIFTIPSFKNSRQVVLLNLSDLSLQLICFK